MTVREIAIALDGDGFVLGLIGFELKSGGFSFHNEAEMTASSRVPGGWNIDDDMTGKTTFVSDELMEEAHKAISEGDQ